MSAFELVGATALEEQSLTNLAPLNSQAYLNCVAAILANGEAARLRPISCASDIYKNSQLQHDQALWTWAAAATLLDQHRRGTIMTPTCHRCCITTGTFCDVCLSCDEDFNWQCAFCNEVE